MTGVSTPGIVNGMTTTRKHKTSQIPDERQVLGPDGVVEWVPVFCPSDEVCMAGTDLTGTVDAYEWNHEKSAHVRWDIYTVEEGDASWIEPRYLALVHSPTLDRLGR